MDLLGSIMKSMDKPPSLNDKEKQLRKKRKEEFDRRQREEKENYQRFKDKVEVKLCTYFKEDTNTNLKFSPMDQIYRSIVHEAAEAAGLVSYAFGEDGVDRHVRVYKKENAPCELELFARRRGEPWNEEVKQKMLLQKEKHRLHLREEEVRKPEKIVPNSNYKDKYAHLIGHDSALEAARKTETNKCYGFGSIVIVIVMKAQEIPCSINKVIALKDSIVGFLKQPNSDERNVVATSNHIDGGVLSDIRYSWLTAGARLQVLHTKSGNKLAAWTFGAVLHDFQTSVSCVTDLPSSENDRLGKPPLLVVGLECELTGGMVCIFDISSSRVIRAIQIGEKVTSIHVVNGGCDSSLPGSLRALDGVLAIGTAKGNILIVDLCRQACEDALLNNGSENIKDEINSCQLMPILVHDLKNLEKHKEIALQTGQHLSLQLNESCTSGPHFSLKGPNGEDRLHAAKHEVTISSMFYCHQLGSLLVGYNFGAFQLYNLLMIKLEYTSPVYEDCIPVTHFSIQEPCEDPRAFCYVWVMYSGQENDEAGFPVAVMYALAYNTKDYLDDYGYLYQDLISCSVRFQTDLNAIPGHTDICKPMGGKCVSLRSHTKGIFNKHCTTSMQDVHEENLAVCVVVWTVWDANGGRDTFLCLFDLNQWYKEQMPSTPRIEECGSYMVHVSLTALFRPVSDCCSDLLDTRLDAATINQFICAQRLEEHYFPSALAFKCVCIREEDLIWFGSSGAQRHLLSCIEQAGPLCLLRPSDIFHQCIALGLAPLYTDVSYNTSTPLPIQREMILSIALEHQLIYWLCCCAQQWSNGSQSSAGCTLDFLLDWAWQRANTLKYNANKLCVPLFDYSGLRLDANALVQLNHCACQLKHLSTLFGKVVNGCTMFLSKEDISDIQYQWKALEMISVYLEVLQWLLNVGLLPECPLSMYPRPDESERISAPYPADSLERFYQCRRSELCELRTANPCASNRSSCDLLFIDNLIDFECGGQALRKQWQTDGGTGLYPPPSLQALLRTYLIEDIDIVHKHCLFIYVFLDLAMSLDQSRYKPIITHLIKFPAVFRLSPSIIKTTQAFWQLDHGDFSTAMAQLLDPSVYCDDLKPWHHRTVLRSLLIQGQHQHALLYQQVRKPPVTHLQDICIIVTLFIVNDMLQEAFHFQRQNRTACNQKDLLNHFFEVCEKTKQLFAVVQLPLCTTEELEFVCFLKAHLNDDDDDDDKNLLVVYYLQRDRYLEAFGINDKINGNDIARQGLLGQQEIHFRNQVIDGFKKTLPGVTQRLMEFCKKNKLIEVKRETTVVRPTPMSVFVHDTKEQAKYKSTIIEASLQKARETWMNENCDKFVETPFISTPKMIMTKVIRTATPVIYPSINYPLDISKLAEDHEEDINPAKRMKLSPRQSVRSAADRTEILDQFRKRLSCYDSVPLLDTPIVKRKSYRTTSQVDVLQDFGIGTPPSILKVRSLLRTSQSPPDRQSLRGTSTTPVLLLDDSSNDDDDDDDDVVVPFDKNIANIVNSTSLNLLDSVSRRRKSSLGVSPRKPIQRTPRPAVHFEENKKTPHSSEKMEIDIPIHMMESSEKSIEIDSKDSSQDQFFSPNTSLSDSNVTTNTNIDLAPELMKRELLSNDPVQSKSLKRKISDTTSVKSRRSYKSNAETSASALLPTSKDVIITTKSALELPSPRKTDTFPKVVGRRSLTRQVLEQNIIITKQVATTPPRMHTRLSIAKLSSSNSKTVGVEVSYSKRTTSVSEETIDNKVENIVDTFSYDLKNVFSSERDPKSTAQIIKHVHNEQSSKSNVTEEVMAEKDDDDNDDDDNDNDNDDDDDDDDNHHHHHHHDHDSVMPEPVLPVDSDVAEDSFIKRCTPSNRYSYLSLSDSKNSSIFIESEQQDDEHLENVSLHPVQHEEEPKSTETSIFEDLPSITDESNFTENDTTEETPLEEEEVMGQMEVAIVIAPNDGQIGEIENICAPLDTTETSLTSLIIKDLTEDENQAEQLDFEPEDESDNEELISKQDEGDELDEQESDVEELLSNRGEDEIYHVNILSNRSSDLEQVEELSNLQIDSNDEFGSSEEEKESEHNGMSRDSEENVSDEESNEEVQDEIDEQVEESSENASSRSTNIIEIPSTSDEDSNENTGASEMELEQCIEEHSQQDDIELVEIVDDEVIQAEGLEGYHQDSLNDFEQVVEYSPEMVLKEDVVEEVQAINENLEIKLQESQMEGTDVLEMNISKKTTTTKSKQEHDEEIHEIEENEKVQIQEIQFERNKEKIEKIKENLNAELEKTQTEHRNVLEKNITSAERMFNAGCQFSICSTEITSPEEKYDEIEEAIQFKESKQRKVNAAETIEKNTFTSNNEDAALVEVEVSKNQGTRASSRKRSTSVDEETRAIKRSTRASSLVVTNLPVIEEKKRTTRKQRAASVDLDTLKLMKSESKTIRTQRSSSIEPDTLKKRSPRSKSTQSNVITMKQTEIEPKSGLDTIPEKIEEYSATHRMTRRQLQIMKKSMELQEMRKLEKAAEMMDQMNPINLLDKPSFTGDPDLEESHRRSTSPASSVDTQSSVATRTSVRLRNKKLHQSTGPESVESIPTTPKRKKGRASVSCSLEMAEDQSPVKDTKSVGGEGGSNNSSSTSSSIIIKPRRKSFTLAQQIITTPTRARRSGRVNSQDTDISDASSVVSVPIVEIQRLSDKEIMMRHRSLSPALLQEDAVAASPRGRRKSTRTSILPLRIDLSKISEENATATTTTTAASAASATATAAATTTDLASVQSEATAASDDQRRRPKKKKKSSSQSDIDGHNTDALRPTSMGHVPLEQFASKHTVLNRRKTFKLKRLTRHSPNN